ncbi:hypothetical protein MNBD_GAMMA16-993 [hydrothermal vent metagenome]|uniref:GIY-YIG domain-containing protein n=1 Tax=hydrothermal vent metagenome TaxID=652676 RepID=A0A3B0YSD4_9ZZZZ
MARTVSQSWWVYIVSCADTTLYTGITTNVERRVAEHNSENVLAAKYTRARQPVVLVYKEACSSRSVAARREHEIKKMRRTAKEALCG